ncbi:MAG: DUF309 domain-containing protein [Thermoplasmatota archaeon]
MVPPRGDPDPRVVHAPVAEVPRLVAAGASHWNARDHWHAHEHWESAWHALRGAGRVEEAEFVHGLILVTAGFENLARGKVEGFARQVASGLRRLRAQRGRGIGLGVRGEDEFREGVTDFFLGVVGARVPRDAGAARETRLREVSGALAFPRLVVA